MRAVHLMVSPPRVQHFDLMLFADYTLSLSVWVSPREPWKAAAQKGVGSKKTDPLVFLTPSGFPPVAPLCSTTVLRSRDERRRRKEK